MRGFNIDLAYFPVIKNVKRLHMSVQERKWLYHTELIKVGVDFNKAEKVAKILAENLSEEQLTQEENQLVQNACAQWLAQRKRNSFISQVLSSSRK